MRLSVTRWVQAHTPWCASEISCVGIALCAGLPLVLLPCMDGGRSDGYLCIVSLSAAVAALWTWFVKIPAVPRGWLAVPAVIVALAWSNLLWSVCPGDTLRAVLEITVFCVLWLVLVSALSSAVGRTTVAICLSVGLLISSCLVAWQVLTPHLSCPDQWLDPAYRGDISFRAGGGTSNPNILAGYLAYALPLALSLTVSSNGALGWICGAGSGLSAGSLILTYSRANWLGAAIGSLPVVWQVVRGRSHRSSWRLLPVAVLSVAAVTMNLHGTVERAVRVPQASDGTLTHRIFMWNTAARMLRTHLVAGVGLGAFQAAYGAYRPPGVRREYALLTLPGSAHSDYAQLVAETGVLGAALLLGVLAALIVMCRKGASGSEGQSVRAGLWGVLVSALVSGLAQSNSQTPLCLIIAVLAAAWLVQPVAASRLSRGVKAAPRGAYLAGAIMCVIASVIFALLNATAVWRGESRMLAERGQLNQAARLAERCLRTNPIDGQNWSLYGDLKMVPSGNSLSASALEQAGAYYRCALRRDPLAGMLAAKIADVSEAQGDVSEAYKWYVRACDMDPYRATFQLQAGRLAGDLEKDQASGKHLKEALALFPMWISLHQKRNNWPELQLQQRAYEDAKRRQVSITQSRSRATGARH